MNGETHLIGGWAAAMLVDRWLTSVAARGEVVYVFGVPVSQGLIAAAVVGLGALLPDIDEPNSTISNLPNRSKRYVPFRSRDAVSSALRAVVQSVADFFNLLIQFLSTVIRVMAGGHRAATHWLITGGVLTLLAWLLGESIRQPRLWLWFGIGYASHLVLDMMTVRGLKVLRPLTKRTFYLLPKPLRVKTGSFIEHGLRAWLIVLIVWFLFAL